MTFKFIRNKIIYFSLFLALGIIYFAGREVNAGHQNAAVVCLIDDMSNSFKTQVFYTGQSIEMGRISQFLPNDVQIVDGEEDRLNLLDFHTYAVNGEDADSSTDNFYAEVHVNNGDAGKTSVYLVSNVSGEVKYPLISLSGVSEGSDYSDVRTALEDSGFFDYDKVEESASYVTPLTFPADITLDANAAEINRAYEISDVLGGDFNDALMFINGGKGFTSTNELISTAYGLCVIEDDSTLTNSSNMNYKVDYGTTSNDNGYTYKCTISNKESSGSNYEALYNPNYQNTQDLTDSLTTKTGSYVWKIKKGYKNSSYGEDMEDGTKNQIANRYGSSIEDTTYITWQHLFLQASIYYAEGITYANQSDIYSLQGMEDSITKFFQRLLDSVSGFVNTYSMEELIFNKGVRGSKAFFLGTFNKNFETYLLNMFLIFSAISVSLVFFIIVRMILKRQLSTANAFERASFAESVKDLLISLFFMAFSWGAIKVLLVLNYQFVDIFSTLVGNKSLQRITAGGVIIGGIVVKFTYFILEIYINYVYIIRGLVIAALIIVAPLFIIAFNFGQRGKEMFFAWLRELTGSIFLQSLHALVYGIIIVASVGSRGIEGIVMIAAIIPLTSMFKEITGSGGDTILKTAAGLTKTTSETMGNAAQLAGTVASSAASGMGQLAGTAIGAIAGGGGGAGIGGDIGKSIGDAVGGMAEAAGGMMAAGIGTGLEVSTIGGGSGMMASGSKQMGKGISKTINSTANAMSSAVKTGAGASDGSGGMDFGEDGGDDYSDGGASFMGATPSVKTSDSISHADRKAALDSLHGNPYLKAMQDARVAPDSDGSWAVKRGGGTAVEQSYMVPSGAAMRDMTKSQEAVYKAIQNHNSDQLNNTMAHFNKQYGADYSRVSTKMVEGKGYDVITFGKWITPPPAPSTPAAPNPSAQASVKVDPNTV